MDNFKKKRAHWELKEEELDSSVWKRRFGRPNLSQNRLRNEFECNCRLQKIYLACHYLEGPAGYLILLV
jgi:hypothetical protein